MDLSHKNTVVILNNKEELAYMQKWGDERGFKIGRFDSFPIAISPNDGGWTNHMDRALYYINFIDFVNAEFDKGE